MNIALWILQVLVGGFFVWHMNLLLRPNPERLRQGMNWVLEMPAGLRIFAGIAEGLAGVALVFAGLIPPVSWLVALAGARLALFVLGAIVFHLPPPRNPNSGLHGLLPLLSGFI